MPVDFTNKKKNKTNYEFLQEILASNEEGLEFLEGFKSEKENEIDTLKDEISTKETEIDDRDSTIKEMEEEWEYSDVIDTKLGANGDIKWEADNLAAKSMMEELDNAIRRGIPLMNIENILRQL